MSPSRRFLLFVVFPLLAAVVQLAWSHAMAIKGAQPQLPLLLTALGATFCNANEGALLGFLNGFLFASISPLLGGGLGGILVGNTMVGFGIGWLGERVFRGSTFLSPVFAGLGTLVADLFFLLAAPPPVFLHWLLVSAKTILYNMALALPLYPLLRFALGGRTDAQAMPSS